jgi:tRNA nucleotidyltransferase/poly(A) polymerase
MDFSSPALSLERLASIMPFARFLQEISAGGPPIHLVGGSLRNLMLGREVPDWDFVVEGDAGAAAREIARKTGSHFFVLDEQNQVFRVVPRDVRHAGHLDFARCRGSIEEDLALRDYTINAMALSLQTGRLADPLNGASGVRQGVLRLCSDRSIPDDPLRILRAYRLKMQLGLEIDEDTRRRLVLGAALLKTTAWERIRDEIYAIFSGDDSCSIIREAYGDGVLPVVLPELPAMDGMSQNRFHMYDVLEHSFHVLGEMEKIVRDNLPPIFEWMEPFRDYLSSSLAGSRTRLQTMKLAALLHDMGKPASRREDGDKVYYAGHHLKGEEMWKKTASRFRLSRSEEGLGQAMVQNHLQPIFLPLEEDRDERDRKVYRFFSQCGMSAPAVILLSWADVEAGRGPDLTEGMIEKHHQFSLYLARAYFSKDRISHPPAWADGRDVLKVAGVPPGPQVKEILSRLREMSALCKIDSREEALEFLAQIKAAPPGMMEE